MSITKSQFTRLMLIDEIIRTNKGELTRDMLHEKLERKLDSTISKKQMHEDLKLLREGYDVPLIYSRKLKTYYYDLPLGTKQLESPFKLVLNRRDLNLLRLASDMFRQLKGLSEQGEIDEAVKKLEKNFKFGPLPPENVIEYDTAPVKGTDFIQPLYEAITLKEIQHVEYQPFNLEKLEFVFHPYFLKEYNGRWFCMGYNSTDEKRFTLALDRIISAQKTFGEPYIPKEKHYPEDLFRNIVGVTLPDGEIAQHIVIRLSAIRAPYLSTKPLHSSQTEQRQEDGSSHFQFYLVVNKELIAALLQYGSDLTVLQPVSLAKQIKEILEVGQRNYGPNSFDVQ